MGFISETSGVFLTNADFMSLWYISSVIVPDSSAS